MRFMLAFLCASVAYGADPIASITYLRSNDNPPLVMVAPMAMSGDGKTVVGQYMIWTAETGLKPAGFSPDELGYLNIQALNYDGTIRFGDINSFAGLYYRFWSGPWGFGRDDSPFSFESTTDITCPRRTLSGDGLWMAGRSTADSAFRVQRPDVTQSLNGAGSAGCAAINFDGSVVVGVKYGTGGTFGAVWTFAPVEGGFEVETQLFPKAEFDSVSADGEYAAGFFDWGGGGARYLGMLWKIGQEADKFHPPLGSSGITYTNFVSNGGLFAAGVATRPGWPRAFIRRQGERARDLRQVLQRFGATNLDYYLLTNISGLSDDGTTVCGYAQSPWFGNVAFVASFPEWPACPADINFDGVVDDADFSIFAGAYNELVNTDGDFNVDGLTDDADFAVFAPAYDRLACE
ncbi:MAG: hypothetical protein ACREJD_03710 [Phycisphaerales bacterium]